MPLPDTKGGAKGEKRQLHEVPPYEVLSSLLGRRQYEARHRFCRARGWAFRETPEVAPPEGGRAA